MDIIIMFVWIVRLSKIFIIVLVISSFDKVVVSTLFRNLYKGDVNLCTMYTTTLSDEKMTKIKVVDIEKIHNFVVDNI
jgi:hypothetical protein